MYSLQSKNVALQFIELNIERISVRISNSFILFPDPGIWRRKNDDQGL